MLEIVLGALVMIGVFVFGAMSRIHGIMCSFGTKIGSANPRSSSALLKGAHYFWPPHVWMARVENSVRDMIELLESLGREKAVWVGHDWGSPVVWAIASHHPDRCHGVANLCVPYLPKGFAPENFLPFVDRALYPEDEFPAGQWEYQLFYQENFSAACAAFEANPRDTVKALFRKGDAAARGQPARTALIRKNRGWFGGAGRAPDVPMDPDVLTEADLAAYVAALECNGFFGPDSWYMNHDRRCPGGC